MRISDWSSDVCSSDLELEGLQKRLELSKQIKAASDAKEDLNSRVTRLKAEIEAISRAQGNRKREALTLISNRTKALLDKDLQEHSAFGAVADRKSTRLNYSH